MDKTWLQVEIDESIDLLRKRLEKLNDTDPNRIDCDEVHEMHEIYKTLHVIKMLKA